MCDYTVGDVVKCIDDTPSRPESQVMPELGTLYTVAGMRPVEGGVSVRLGELVPTCWKGGVCACNECGWDSGRFRKVHTPNPGLIEALRQGLYEPAPESEA